MTILKINQVKGFTIIECRSITTDATDAKAANTLIWPTRETKLDIVFAPTK